MSVTIPENMRREVDKYTFKNGEVITSRLEKDELMKRMKRLDTLRVLTEGYTDGQEKSIFKKALREYNKENDFTGIIRLSIHERDFIDIKNNV